MTDLVATCPKGFWLEWLEEGDCAGEPWSGGEYEWRTMSRAAKLARRGDRFYVVAHGRLRGWAPVIFVLYPYEFENGYAIRRGGNAVACTIDEAIPGFQGLRRRWWSREVEHPFPDWRTP